MAALPPYHRAVSSASDKSPWVRVAVVVVWAVAFAFVEAMVVYYIRKLFGLQYHLTYVPADFHFPRAYLPYEQAREAATMVMLLAVGFLAGRTWWQRFAFWLLAFGVWDIFYYVWLWVLLRWPSSPGTRDLLFLLPNEWWAPVWQPVLVSMRLRRRRRGDPRADAARLTSAASAGAGRGPPSLWADWTGERLGLVQRTAIGPWAVIAGE